MPVPESEMFTIASFSVFSTKIFSTPPSIMAFNEFRNKFRKTCCRRMPCPNTHASWNKLKKSVPVTWFELRPVNLSAVVFQVRRKPLESVDKDYVSALSTILAKCLCVLTTSSPNLICSVTSSMSSVTSWTCVPTRWKKEGCSNIPWVAHQGPCKSFSRQMTWYSDRKLDELWRLYPYFQ
jgi:hypothetical protein